MIQENEDLSTAKATMDVRSRLDDGVGSSYCLSLPSSASPDTDDRKRPLSITSTSSASSSSSLPRPIRKRIANMSSSVAIGSSVADVGVSNASCETLSTVAECSSPVDAHCLNACSGFFDKDFNEGSKSNMSVDKIPGSSSLCQYNSSVTDDYLATSDVEESTGSSERNSCDCLDGSESKLLTGFAYVERVVAEILETERNYVKDLSDLVQGYICHIRNDVELELSGNDIDALFGNIEIIYQFNRHFLSRLEECGHDPIKLANCFVNNIRGFEIYSTYCTNYPRSMETLMRIMKDEKVASFLKRQQMLLQHGLPLGSYLLKPVQRILKYHILLQNIFDNHDSSEEGHDVIEKALDSMMNVALHINEMKRQHEHAVRLQEIQCHLCDWDGTDLMTLGNLILEEWFRVCGAKALRRLFLFEKALLLTKEREDGMLLVKSFILFSNLMVIESVPKEPLSFQLIPYNAPREQVTLQASSLEQKRFWCQWIKKLMLENYGPKIPDKAKELVMMLGKSREEEDFESSNLEIPELVKKQHNAPAYLEKRKGRRKSAGFIHDLKLKPRKGQRSGLSTSDTSKFKTDGNKSDVTSSVDHLPATDDEECFGCGDDDKKVRETSASGRYKTDHSFSSQSSCSPATTPTSKFREKIGLDPSRSACSVSVGPDSIETDVQLVNPGKVDSKFCLENGKHAQRIATSKSVASLVTVPGDVTGQSSDSFHRSNSASFELHQAGKNPVLRVDWTAEDSCDDDDNNQAETIESGDYQIKWYRSLRKPASSCHALSRKSVSGSLGSQMQAEPSETSDGWRRSPAKVITASCSCTKLPSQGNTSTPTLQEKYEHACQFSGRSPKKILDQRLNVKFSKSLKSNLAKEVIADNRYDLEDDSEDDDHLNSVHNALKRLTSRIPTESLQSINSCSTVHARISNPGSPSEKSESLSLKSEDRKDVRNKLARLLGRSPNGCQQKNKSPSEGSSPSSPSLAEFLKDRRSVIGERMAVSPDHTFDSRFTIASRIPHHRTPLSECQQLFNKVQTDSADNGTGSVEPVGDNVPTQPYDVKIKTEKDICEGVGDVTRQLFRRNDSSGGSDTEFYYENKLLADLEDGLKDDDDGHSLEIRSDEDASTSISCSPLTKPTIPLPRMTIKETMHSIERRSNARPMRKVEVLLGEKAQGMREILQTLENVGKNGYNSSSTLHGKIVHRTVRDRTRELAVCAAITRVRQNCNVVNVESVTLDNDYLSQPNSRCNVSLHGSLQPETRTSHL